MIFLGSYVKVLYANSPNYVGLEGLVIHESANKSSDAFIIFNPNKKKSYRLEKCILLIDGKIYKSTSKVKYFKKLNLNFSQI